MVVRVHPLLAQLKVFALIIGLASLSFTQSLKAPATKQEPKQIDLTLERASLISELQFLDKETLRFNDPLAEALAKAEIADAAWQLDRDWAKKLLRAAYELVLPKADQNQKQNRPAGSIPPTRDATDRSRQRVRLRVLEIARRDKDFVKSLIQSEAENAGEYEKHFTYAALADQSIEAGDVKASADYVLQGIQADPTQGTAPDIINRIALRDRALADSLVLRYISELRGFPLSSKNQSDIRTFFILSGLMNPVSVYDPNTRIPAPSPEVMRAYVSYMLEALGILEQKEPGYLQIRRRMLLSLWIPLQQYAPELAGAFLNLESRSRRPGEKTSLPTVASIEEERRSRYERRIKSGLDSDQPNEAIIYSAVSKGDFEKARKMIDKLPDGAKKRQLFEMVNAEEATNLITNGDLYAAESLSKELRSTASISKVYPLLIKKFIANKDQLNATRLVYQALRQVKDSDSSPPPVPEGIPVSAVSSDQRFDPRLTFVSKLAVEILPHSTELAFDILDEFVSVANSTHMEEQAKIAFDISVFKKLADKNETRTQQAAYSLRNLVQRVLALTAIHQLKAKELTEKHSKPAKASSINPNPQPTYALSRITDH